MSQMNVEQFANELGMPPAALLEQLQAAGVSKQLTVDHLTERDKTQLLDYLRKIHGAKDEKSKISLPRRQTSEIKKSDSTGKPRSIQVEVRKKRVVVKGDIGDKVVAVDKPAEPIAPSVPAAAQVSAPVIDAAQQALRQEEARKQAELIARQTAELKEKKQRQKPAAAETKEPEPAAAAPAAAETLPAAAPAAAPSVSETGVGAPQPQPAPTEGTLHKPVVKPEDKAAKAEKKKKQTKQVVWKDERIEKRGLKTRGDLSGGKGWRTRRDKHAKVSAEDQGAHSFSAPTEPVVHEVM
ncbi:MAG: translation initiation factor IF-2 associated domain-containing protein, partial [Nitrosospira sp.]